MKIEVSTNRYPNNYVEGPLPHILVEVRFKNDGNFNRRKASMLAEDIKNSSKGELLPIVVK